MRYNLEYHSYSALMILNPKEQECYYPFSTFRRLHIMSTSIKNGKELHSTTS